MEHADTVLESDKVVAGRFEGICGSSEGSRGGRGGLGVPLRFPSDVDWSEETVDGIGGEYCVPASTVALITEAEDVSLSSGFGVLVGD